MNRIGKIRTLLKIGAGPLHSLRSRVAPVTSDLFMAGSYEEISTHYQTGYSRYQCDHHASAQRRQR